NLAVGNAIVADADFQDKLAVSAVSANTGLLTVANPATQIAAGGSGNVVLTAAAPGSLATSVALTLQSKALAGTGLDDKTLTPGSVAVTGTAYDLASATYGATVSFGNVRLNTPRTLTVTNALRTVGAAAYQDDLAVAATSGTAKVTVAAPADIRADRTGDVTLTSAAAGSLASTLTLGFTSTGKVAGAAITGLSTAALTGGTVTVTGTAYDFANASADSTLAFGSVRRGDTLGLPVTNAVITAAAYQDDLSVAAAFGTAKLTAVNPALITAGTSRDVVVTAAKVGSLADTLTLTYVSKALAVSGLDDGAATTQTVAVTGTAYDLAAATHEATLALNNIRVTTGTGSLAVTNALATGGDASYQDKLDITATSSNARLSVTSASTGVVAGTAGAVGVKAITAGSLAGNLTLGFTSKALAGSNLADVGLTNGTVAVTGAAYDLATATVQATLDLGNIRKGALTNVAVANTVTTSASYQDSLDVTSTATTNANLTLAAPGNILAGASRNLGVTAAIAGDLAATLTLNLRSNANNVDGLENANLTAKTVAVTGTAYDLASPTVASSLAFAAANVRVGATTNLNIANTTVTSATYQDSLDVTAATSNAKLTLGTVANIGAGVDRNLVVTAATAGDLASTLTLNLTSNANGVADLANAALSAKTVTVTGAAYDLANASAASTLAFGSVRTSSTASLAVTNAVRTAAAYQDDLSVASAFGTNKLTAVNPANIAAGVTRDLVVTAAKAGLLTDTLTLTYGSKALAISGLADGANTTQAVAVTGTAYDVAQPAFNATLALNNIRTGAGANLAVGNTTVTAAAYQDDLAIAASAANGKLTLTNPALVAAGASGNVAVVANAAGSLAGDLTLGFTSKALAASGLADVGLTGGTVTVSGFAYDLASASVLNTLNVGNVRKGDTANIVVGNSTITNASYQDALQVAATSSNTGVLTVANPANITAGQTGNVVLTTGVAGSLAGTNVSLVLTSKAAASGLSDATLTPQTVAIAGAAYDYASPDVPAGLTFGNVRLGATATLAVGNTT
ncbi:hypothetical protein EBR16_03610, partial [bacterium]|nr:hypothetical protein [bacterium]